MPVSNRQIQSITNGPAQLHVVSYPRSGAESVLLLHGGPGTPDEMPDVARLLAPRYQVLYYDQRGTGHSACTGSCTYTIEDHLSDIRSIMAHFGLQQLHLFGHSWGGLLAQFFAWQYPQQLQSLFLCSPAAGAGMQWRQMEMELFCYGLSRSSLLEWPLLSMRLVLGRFGSNSNIRDFYRQFHDISHRGFAAQPPSEEDVKLIKAEPSNQTRIGILSHPQLPDVLQLPVQVTITYSDHDIDIFRIGRKHVIRRFPDARVINIQDAGHFPWLHNLPAFQMALGQHFSIG